MLKLFLPLLFVFSCYLQNPVIDRSVSLVRASAPNLPYASGLILPDGNVLTVFHAVIGNEKEIRIRTEDGNLSEVEIIHLEFAFDLALLSPKTIHLTVSPFPLKERQDLKPGEEIYSFSSPYGLDHSYLQGYISHIDRTGLDPTYPQIPFIQTIGISDPGSSGSGVFTKEGEFIGIQRSNFGYQAGGEFGLVIPTGFIKKFLNLIKDKKSSRSVNF